MVTRRSSYWKADPPEASSNSLRDVLGSAFIEMCPDDGTYPYECDDFAKTPHWPTIIKWGVVLHSLFVLDSRGAYYAQGDICDAIHLQAAS